MKVRFLRIAEEEYLDAVRYYVDQGSDLGGAFLEEIEQAVDLIRAHSQAGSPRPERTRRLLLRKFPYSLIYTVEDDEALVIAVRHHKQGPIPWRERLKR